MAELIGKIEDLEGKFLIQDSQGNTRELKNGDEVYSGEIILPDSNNAPSDSITIIPKEGTEPFKIDSTKDQLLDSTILNKNLNNEDLVFNPESVQDAIILNNKIIDSEEQQTAQFANLDGSQTDVNSDLRQRQFGGNDSEYRQDAEETQAAQFANLDGAKTDVNSDLRQANWPGVIDYENIQNNNAEIGSNSGFTPRDGASTDVVSDLRKAQWFAPIEEPTFDGDVDNENDTVIISKNVDVTEIVINGTPKTIIKVVAADSSGNPLTDTDGNYLEVNETPEGGDVYYVALAFSPSTTVFNAITQETIQEGTVDFTFADETAESADYTTSTSLTSIALGTAFTTGTAEDDYIADNGEQFTVTISNYTPITAPTVSYGTTTINNTGVTTTITDNTGNSTVESDAEDTIIKLIALDSNGAAILDENGNYTFANSATEGEVAQYKALAFDSNETTFNSTTQLSEQLGSVKVSTGDTTTTTGSDYTALNTRIVALNTSFSVTTVADYISDDGEAYTLSIDSYVAPTSGDAYENVSANGSVTTTIINTVGTTLVKLIAVNEDGSAILDTNGNYTFVNSTSEGADVYYKALAFDSSETTFAENSELSNQLGSVTVSSGDTSSTAGSDYTALTSAEIALDTVFSMSTSEDYVLDDNETYTVSIDSYVAPTTGDVYDSVTASGTVTTTITDSTEAVVIKLIALDSNGAVILDTDGNYTFVNSTTEGDVAQYKALAFGVSNTTFFNGSELNNQLGSVTVSSSDATATLGNDYTAQNTTTEITLGTAFNITTLDDYIADNNETYTVNIDSYTAPSTGDNYIGVTTSGTVTTTITDDSTTGTAVESDAEDTIVKLIALDSNGAAILDENGNYTFANSATEGEVAQYKALAFDSLNITFASGSELSSQLGSVTVNSSDNSTTLSSTTVALNTAFSVTTVDDYIADASETYSVSIESYVTPISGDIYENVSASTSTSITTTVTDNTSSTTIKLIAVDENGDAILDSGNYTFVNSASEEGLVYYKALAFDSSNTTFSNGSELTDQIGSVTVSSSNTTATAGSDYTALTTTTVALGTVFSTTTLDDNISDDTETYTVNIDSYVAPTSGDTYEDVSTNGSVTSTITDNTGDNTVETDAEDAIVKLIAVNSSGDAILDTAGNYTFVNSTTEGGSVYYKALAFDASESTFSNGSELDNQLGSVTVSSSDNNSAQVSGTDAIAGTDYTTTNTSVALGTVFSIATADDFTADDSETYTVNIDSYTAPTTGDTYENVSTSGTVTTTILDGITLGTPTNASVDEDGLNDGTDVYTDTKSLGIIGNSDDYTVAFDTNMAVTTRTSGGSVITYAFTDSDTLLTATDTNGTEVFTVQINADDTYTYTLLETITHDVDNTTAENDFDMSFDFTVTSEGTTSPVQTFDVNVKDSVPVASPNVAVSTDEDTSVDITLSDDSFTSGGVKINSISLATGSSVDIFDPVATTTKVGELLNNGDGTLTFTPIDNYSGSPTFTYGVTDLDGDSGEGTVSITINPVADAPTVTVNDVSGLEDAESTQTTGNTNEGTNSIALNLTLPTLSTDQTDANSTATGDNPELLGYIELTFTNGTAISGAKLMNGSDEISITSDDQVVKIVIVDVNGDVDSTYHHSSIALGETGVTYLTATEYAALQMIHAEDNDTDIDISIATTSYEVDDSGVPITGIDGAITSSDMSVLINPSTDDISLAWDNNTSSLGTYSGDKFTFNTIAEDSGAAKTLDLQSLLTNTSGTDSDGDLDGSEERLYTITGIPNGTVINLGGTTVTASGGTTDNSADGSATVTFSSASNQEEDPTFTMTLPEYYSGTITNATITLSTQDNGADSTDTASSVKTASAAISFAITVTAVAGEATVQIGQIEGDEDAGRSSGNISSTVSTIDEPENGIELDIKVTSDDPDGSEEYIVRIDDIPADSSLYVYDNSLSSYVLIDSTSVTSGDISVTANIDGTWQITIKDFQNDNLPKFIPPHNSDTDYTLKVNAQTIDDTDLWNGLWTEVADKDMVITVNEVADIPINTDLNGYDIDGNSGSTYNLVLSEGTLDSETNSFALSEVYKTPTALASYDSDSETLSIIISGLEDGFSVEGASSIGTGVWTFLADDIANITITTPKNFSGESTFDLKYVTTENAGDSKTHSTDTVTIYVSPSEDDVTTTNTTIYEDGVAYTDEDGVVSTNKIDLSATINDTDGSESITAVKILVTSVPTGFALYSDASFNTALTDFDGDGYYELTYAQAQSVYAKNTTEHSADNSDNFDLTVVYTVQDTAKDTSDTTITSATTTADFTHTISVTVDAVTDAPDIAINTIDDTTSTDLTVSGTTVTVAADGTSFTVPITTTSSDTDGSENVTQILISGVPQGVTVDNGTYQGYIGSIENGVWLIDGTNLTDTILDSNGSDQNITFTVNAGADFSNRNISITTYTKDADDSSEELSTSTTFELIMDYNTTGPGPGIPPKFTLGIKEAVIYEDDKNDTNTYNLGESLTVSHTGTPNHGGYAVTISGFAEGTVLSGYSYSYVEGGVTYYVVSGTGNAADVESKLSNVIVTPPENVNDVSESTESMVFTASIATYAGGTFEDGNTVNYAESINPVTDDMTITIAASDTNEDTATTLSITLTNDVDSSTAIVGDTMYIKVNENFESGETSTGTFSYGGVVLSTTSTTIDGVTGEYYVVDITGYTLGNTLDFEYTPGTDRHGDVTFDVVVYNQEGESWASYDTAIQTSTNSATITVAAVVDGLASSVSDASGTEASNGDDNKVQIDISAVLSDASESLGSVTLDKIPNGFLIYYGVDASSLSLASNTGESATYTGTYDVDIYSDDDDAVTYNQWLIPLDSDGTLPDAIYIQAPENWSGTLEDIVLNLSGISDGAESSAISYNFNVTFDASADDITIAPTLTFGDAFSWLDLKINANIEDTDGSETMSATLTGLDDSAQFRLSDGTLFDGLTGNPSATYDSGTWTLEGVPYDKINNIQFLNDTSVASVEITVNTVEQLNGNVGASSSTETFAVNLTDASGTLTLEEGINLDFSKLDDTSSFNTVTEIDLSVTGENKIENLSLEDLLSTSDGTALTITGTTDDSVSLDGNWIAGTSDSGYTEYTNSDDATVSLKIDDTITNVTIA